MTNATACPFTLTDLPMPRDRSTAWRMLREAGPVAEIGGSYFLTHRASVDVALRHPELFSSAQAFEALGSPLPLVPLAVDPPEHKRYRHILDPFFAPRRVKAMEPDLRRQAGALIDRIARTGRCEVMAELATPYPSQVFLTLFGLPLEDRDRLIKWKDAVIDASGQSIGLDVEPDYESALELYEYLQGCIAKRRAEPVGDDVLTALITTDDQEHALDDNELLGLSFLLVLAGLDTVTAALGFAFQRLVEDPALRRRIVADPSLIPSFAEEVVRLDSPAPILPRVTTSDTELCGVRIPAGAKVSVALPAANRDPAGEGCPADPDAVDLEYGGGRHTGFGGGVHRCLGSHLARAELRLVLEEWHQRIPDYELEAGADPTVPWPVGTTTIDRLPIVFEPVGA